MIGLKWPTGLSDVTCEYNAPLASIKEVRAEGSAQLVAILWPWFHAPARVSATLPEFPSKSSAPPDKLRDSNDLFPVHYSLIT
jgi:hypothetical protein